MPLLLLLLFLVVLYQPTSQKRTGSVDLVGNGIEAPLYRKRNEEKRAVLVGGWSGDVDDCDLGWGGWFLGWQWSCLVKRGSEKVRWLVGGCGWLAGCLNDWWMAMKGKRCRPVLFILGRRRRRHRC